MAIAMDSSDSPPPEDQSTLGKRKRAEDNQESESGLQAPIHNASHMDITEDEHPPTAQPSSPTTKKPRVDGPNHTRLQKESSQSLDSWSALLPPEILQHIFSYLDPLSLARLLSISRLTQMLLDPTKLMLQTPIAGRLRFRDRNDIWAVSRRVFFSAYPRPMENMSEIDMWRLIRGLSCQFCGKKSKGKVPLLATSPWNAGPGPDGVRAIWPFRVRACGGCLESYLVKDSELLLSNSSVLRPGLPFAVLTPSLHYVTSMTLRQSQSPPPGLVLTKYFFRPQMEALEAKMAEARSLGQAATEEWYKGLEESGQSEMSDATRFEQWESSAVSQIQFDPGPARRLSASTSTSPAGTSPAYSMASSAMHSNQFSLNSPRPMSNISTPQYLGSQPASVFGSSTPAYVPFQSLSMVAGYQSPDYRPFAGSFSPMSIGASSSHINSGRPRPERHFHDIIKMKAERRSEIERRCLNLDPPIRASTLTYMDAFNAAVQIPMLLNDNAWDLLKGRILAQRADAERKEADFTTIAAVSELNRDSTPKEEEQKLPSPISADQIWDQIEKPARDKIQAYADEYISSIWAGGRAINKATSGKFAADVLQHVRRRFYEVVAEEDTTLASLQMTIPHDSPLHETRKLKLEDMKWIFEEKIRTHTERFGRELFLCSACDAGGKRFSFDAVIQHYAAKHTIELSHGNAVVYWKADWPAEPPFHPSPDTVWHREPERIGFGSQYAGSQYAASQHATSPPYVPNPVQSWMSPMYVPFGQPNGLYNVQCDELVSVALHMWELTQEIRDLPDSVRLYVIVRHVATRFAQKFANEPPLSMFTDCISHKPDMRAIKYLHGLQCKSCRAFGDSSGSTPFPQDLNASELFEHFQKIHVEIDGRTPQRFVTRPVSMSTMDAPRMDWKFDMIELPNELTIRNLMYSPGINLQKLQTISTVLPHYFPAPLPTIDPIPFETGITSRPPSNDGWRRLDKRPDDGTLYAPPSQYRGPPKQYGETSYDRGYERHDLNPTSYQPRYYIQPRRNLEEIPSRGIVYVERPLDEIGRVEYVRRADQNGSSTRHYRGEEPTILASRGRSYRPSNDSEYISPGPRYSPVVDESPRPRPSDAAKLEAADIQMGDQSDSPAQVQEELRPLSPHHGDVMSATENFLNNFDSIGVNRSTGNTPMHSVHSAASPPRLPSSSRLGERGRLSHVNTPSHSRQVEDNAVSQSSGSRRRTPPPPTASQHRSRNVSPAVPASELSGTPLRVSMRPEDDTLSSTRRPLTPSRASVTPEHERDHWTRQHFNYDDRAEIRLANPPYELQHDDQPSMSQPYRYSHEPPSPVMHYRRRYEEPRRLYVETLPNGQQRVVEEVPAPMEYAQPALRDDRYNDRRGYYVDIASQREIRYVDQYDHTGPGSAYHHHQQPGPVDDERYTTRRTYPRHESDEPRR